LGKSIFLVISFKERNMNRYLFNFSAWIGFWAGLYVILYMISPLKDYGVLYATFVAFPIYFTGGAKKEEFLNYSLSFVLGVCWGFVFLKAIIYLINKGVPVSVSQGVVVGVLAFACLAIHLIITGKTWFNKVPAMFGAIALVFSTGGEKLVPLMITLVLAAVLTVVCQEGTRFLTPEGKWKFSKTPAE
jgi:hypothetical protein